MISASPDPTGPSRETLKALHGMLPSFTKAMHEKKAIGKGTAMRPRKCCPVCGLLHDKIAMKASADMEIKTQTCKDCQKMLDEGWIAFVCGDKYVIARNKSKLADMAGTIQHVGPRVMEELKKVFDVKTKHPDHAPKQQPHDDHPERN